MFFITFTKVLYFLLCLSIITHLFRTILVLIKILQKPIFIFMRCFIVSNFLKNESPAKSVLYNLCISKTKTTHRGGFIMKAVSFTKSLPCWQSVYNTGLCLYFVVWCLCSVVQCLHIDFQILKSSACFSFTTSYSSPL